MTTETGSLPAETQITTGQGHPRLRTDKAEVPGPIPGSPTPRFPGKGPRYSSWHGQQARPVCYLPGVDSDAHMTEPCHAASVNPALEVVAVCTDPPATRGPSPAPSADK